MKIARDPHGGFGDSLQGVFHAGQVTPPRQGRVSELLRLTGHPSSIAYAILATCAAVGARALGHAEVAKTQAVRACAVYKYAK